MNKKQNCSWKYEKSEINREDVFFVREIKKEGDSLTLIDKYEGGFSDTFFFQRGKNLLSFKGYKYWEKSEIKPVMNFIVFNLKIFVFEIEDPRTEDDSSWLFFNDQVGIFLVKSLHFDNYYFLNQNCI